MKLLKIRGSFRKIKNSENKIAQIAIENTQDGTFSQTIDTELSKSNTWSWKKTMTS